MLSALYGCGLCQCRFVPCAIITRRSASPEISTVGMPISDSMRGRWSEVFSACVSVVIVMAEPSINAIVLLLVFMNSSPLFKGSVAKVRLLCKYVIRSCLQRTSFGRRALVVVWPQIRPQTTLSRPKIIVGKSCSPDESGTCQSWSHEGRAEYSHYGIAAIVIVSYVTEANADSLSN